MTNKEKTKQEEEKEELPLVRDDIQEILTAMRPQIIKEKGKDVLVYDALGIGRALDYLKNKEELVLIENEMLGLKVMLQSRLKPAEELLPICIQGMKKIAQETPTRIPFGVG